MRRNSSSLVRKRDWSLNNYFIEKPVVTTADQLSKEVGEYNPGLNVFDCFVRVTGKSRQDEKPKDLEKMVWYVLNNCHEILPYIMC